MTPANSPDDHHLPVPTGEYRLAFGPTAIRAAVGLVGGLGFLLVLIFGLPVDSVLEDVLMRAMAALAGVYFPLHSLALMRRLRGEPRLRITDEGIHIIPEAALSALFPSSRSPKEEFIPWSSIKNIEPAPGPIGSVVIEYEGYEESLWRRWLPKRRDLAPGRILPLAGLSVPGAVLRDQLVFWSKEKEALPMRSAARRLQEKRESRDLEKLPHENPPPGPVFGQP